MNSSLLFNTASLILGLVGMILGPIIFLPNAYTTYFEPENKVAEVRRDTGFQLFFLSTVFVYLGTKDD